MKRADMVRYGAEQLFNAENAIDLAICQSAVLLSELSRMRMESKLSGVIGQGAMDSAAEAITALTSARNAMVRAHGELDLVKVQIGCGAVSVGSTFPKPGTEEPTGRYAEETAAA